MLSKQTNFNSKKYNWIIRKRHTNIGALGGVAIFIHETTPYQKVTLYTPLHAIAARINIESDVTIVSIYNSRSHGISDNIL